MSLVYHSIHDKPSSEPVRTIRYYTSSDTWTKPAGLEYVTVGIIAPGGGGGAGRRGLTGTATNGGGAGAGGDGGAGIITVIEHGTG